jgi:hypothetical protein
MDSGHRKIDISIDSTSPCASAGEIAKISINLKVVIVVARSKKGSQFELLCYISRVYSTANNTRSIVFQ